MDCGESDLISLKNTDPEKIFSNDSVRCVRVIEDPLREVPSVVGNGAWRCVISDPHVSVCT